MIMNAIMFYTSIWTSCVWLSHFNYYCYVCWWGEFYWVLYFDMVIVIFILYIFCFTISDSFRAIGIIFYFFELMDKMHWWTASLDSLIQAENGECSVLTLGSLSTLPYASREYTIVYLYWYTTYIEKNANLKNLFHCNLRKYKLEM